ncbi:MAG: alpha/beta hydrolase [Pseudomonadota bacterium]
MPLRVKVVAGIAIVVIGVALATLGYLRSRMLPRFPYMARPLSDADYAAMAARPGWRAVKLDVAPGVELRGLLREPATPAGPWVIFFNGNSATVLHEGQQVLDALCADHGWGGIVWGYRGFDSSRGAPDPASLEDDGFKAYTALLADQKIRPGAVHIVGFSLGTSVAAAVAARASAQPPASLTLLAPMTHLYLGERTQLRLHRYETEKWLPQIASPTLVIHGDKDATLDVGNGRAVAAALGSRASLLVLPGIAHYELPLTPAAQDAMRTFIEAHAGGGK